MTGTGGISYTHKLEKVEYDHEQSRYLLFVSRWDGSTLTVYDPVKDGHASVREFSEDQTKESPHDRDEEIVEAGTEFLMKVTEEAVLDALDYGNPFDTFNREKNREAAQNIVHKRLTAFVNGEEDITDPLREEDLEPVKVGPVPAPRGFEKAIPEVTRPRSMVKLYGPDDEISYEIPKSVTWIEPADRYSPAAEEYLDATKGPSK